MKKPRKTKLRRWLEYLTEHACSRGQVRARYMARLRDIRKVINRADRTALDFTADRLAIVPKRYMCPTCKDTQCTNNLLAKLYGRDGDERLRKVLRRSIMAHYREFK
jgi:hypothetical protein